MSVSRFEYNLARITLLSLFPMIGIGQILHIQIGNLSLSWGIGMLMPLIFVFFYIGKRIILKKKIFPRKKKVQRSFQILNWLLLFLLLLQAVAIFRSAYIYHLKGVPSSTSAILYLFIVYLYFRALLFVTESRKLVTILVEDFYISILGYMFINILLSVVGFDNQLQEITFLQRATSIKFIDASIPYRLLLPLADGVNSGGGLSAICIILSAWYMVNGKWRKRKLFYSIVMLASIYLFILINHRASFFIVFIGFVIIAFHGKKYINTIPIIIPFMVSLFPIIWINIWFTFEALRLDWFDTVFSRGGSIWHLGKRVEIWEGFLWNWINNLDFIYKMFGYGQSGQIQAGFVYDYAQIFVSTLSNIYSATLHNEMLQVLINDGLVGAAIFSFFLIYLFRCVMIINKLSEESILLVWAVALFSLSIVEVNLVKSSGIVMLTMLIGLATIISNYPIDQISMAGKQY